VIQTQIIGAIGRSVDH